MFHPTEKDSDESCMLRFKEGKAGAFEVLLKRHSDGLYNFLYRQLTHKESADEAFQEVCMRIIASAKGYEPSAKFSTWIYTIARNYLIDQRRRDRSRKSVMMDTRETGGHHAGETLVEERETDRGLNPESSASARDLTERLEAALEKINEDQREVFLLREVEGLPFAEIAYIVHGSVNTVKSRMRYALRALREEFKKLGILDLK